ncbi:MAG: hypothetical protein ACRDSP_10975 [Pseudonocardiaceae bacterium]
MSRSQIVASTGEDGADSGDAGELDEPAPIQFSRLVIVTHEYSR